MNSARKCRPTLAATWEYFAVTISTADDSPGLGFTLREPVGYLVANIPKEGQRRGET